MIHILNYNLTKVFKGRKSWLDGNKPRQFI